MNLILNLVMGIILTFAVYLAMMASGAEHEIALSTAILVASTAVIPSIRSDRMYSSLSNRRKASFERRLDVSADHVTHIIKAKIDEILPPSHNEEKP